MNIWITKEKHHIAYAAEEENLDNVGNIKLA